MVGMVSLILWVEKRVTLLILGFCESLMESHQCLKCQLRIALLELGECRAYWHKMVICRQAMTGH